MNKRIIVEQLRDRLYYASDSFVTYTDSRVLMYNSDKTINDEEKTNKFFHS